MKHVRDSTPEEQAATLAAIKRGAKPEPVDRETPKTAFEMTPIEQAEWLKEHKRRHGQ